MTSSGAGADERRLTQRGLVTRARIVDAAAELMSTRGVAATTLDDIRAVSGTSKSQLYRHFADKDALVHAVVARQGSEVIELNSRGLSKLDSVRGVELWTDALVKQVSARGGAYGCKLGSLAAELSDVDEDARVMLAKMFQQWEELFSDGFERMRAAGVLRPDAEPARLATSVMAAMQGGYLRSQTARSAEPMRIALDMAVAYVRSFEPDAAPTPDPGRKRAATKRAARARRLT